MQRGSKLRGSASAYNFRSAHQLCNFGCVQPFIVLEPQDGKRAELSVHNTHIGMAAAKSEACNTLAEPSLQLNSSAVPVGLRLHDRARTVMATSHFLDCVAEKTDGAAAFLVYLDSSFMPPKAAKSSARVAWSLDEVYVLFAVHFLGFTHPAIRPPLHIFRCRSQSSCSPSAYTMLPQGFASASGLKARDWMCAEENGLKIAFDADLQHLPFCIEGLCKSALPCSPDLQVEGKKLWRCPRGEPQVFTRDPNASNSFFCGVGERGSSAEAADHQNLVLGVLAGTVVALCVGIMMWLARRHPAKVKKSALKLDWLESQVDFHCCSFFVQDLCLLRACGV